MSMCLKLGSRDSDVQASNCSLHLVTVSRVSCAAMPATIAVTKGA
eukprot:CAMPEP_0202877054 /NCGR_PEP_ID=MMETSP1391-20130828/30020_1 /ASSEMBLY_ACC=CAM_ASM_000867 /TAXON_ID=1034604 /ORGANISM="Chlamydomonas leiostraca, Strain SAG 11-49" /LENGTH=44 /DNA_ID= /DNA_START= /DNA_END= /DNA_ORIENTATION=